MEHDAQSMPSSRKAARWSAVVKDLSAGFPGWPNEISAVCFVESGPPSSFDLLLFFPPPPRRQHAFFEQFRSNSKQHLRRSDELWTKRLFNEAEAWEETLNKAAKKTIHFVIGTSRLAFHCPRGETPGRSERETDL
jgi:hypothetical protein